MEKALNGTRNLFYAIVLVVLFGGFSLNAQEVTILNSEEAKGVVSEFTTAWNQHDSKKMASLWVAEGNYMDPWGRLATTRTEVEKLFTEEFQARFSQSQIEQHIQYVLSLPPSLFFIDTEVKVTGMLDSKGKEEPLTIYHNVYLLEQKDGQWKILAARSYELWGRISKVN